jgi:hypothetical protein
MRSLHQQIKSISKQDGFMPAAWSMINFGNDCEAGNYPSRVRRGYNS